MKTQGMYRTNIEYIDKDHVASLFMALCEMNGVYDEQAYYVFIYNNIIAEENPYILEQLKQEAEVMAQKEIEKLLGEVSAWYEDQFVIDSDGKKVISANWVGNENISALEKLNNAKNEKVQEVQDKREGIEQEILENLKKNAVARDWKSIGTQKVYNMGFAYQSMWTYDDVLQYFNKNGFPIKRKSVVDEFGDSLNVCKVRHILRNDILTEEVILLTLLEMQERKDEIEQIKENKKFWQAFMIVVGVLFTIVTAPFTGGASGALLAAQIVGIVASVGSAIVGAVGMVLDSINETELKETTQKTNDLILKNAPKSGNFVDTAITDPYSMYANGRLWKEGEQGRMGMIRCWDMRHTARYLMRTLKTLICLIRLIISAISLLEAISIYRIYIVMGSG